MITPVRRSFGVAPRTAGPAPHSPASRRAGGTPYAPDGRRCAGAARLGSRPRPRACARWHGGGADGGDAVLDGRQHDLLGRVVFPDPRRMAIAKGPPSSTAVSILPITFSWSRDHAMWKVCGKYCSQKALNDRRHAALHSGFIGSWTHPSAAMSRDDSLIAKLRAFTASLCAS